MSKYYKTKINSISKKLKSEKPILEEFKGYPLYGDIEYKMQGITSAIDRHQYLFYKSKDREGDIDICARPKDLKKTNEIACSNTKYDDYAYTHGGKTYRKAVEMTKDIEKLIKKK